jgi:hypothetical protein
MGFLPSQGAIYQHLIFANSLQPSLFAGYHANPGIVLKGAFPMIGNRAETNITVDPKLAIPCFIGN